MKHALLFSLVVTSFAATPVWAQQKPAPGADQIRRLQDAQQRLTAEKNRLSTEKSKLEEDLKKTQSESEQLKASAQKSLAAQRGSMNKLNTRISELEKQLADAQAETTTAKDRIATLTQRSERAEQTGDQLRGQVQRLEETVRFRDQSLVQASSKSAAQDASILECKKHNIELVKVSRELINAYDGKGFSQVLGQREPLLGIGRVAIENKLQSLSDRIDDNIVR